MPAERVIHELRRLLADAGLSGSFLVRDLSTGEEAAIDADRELPIASLVKLPLAIAVLDRVRTGRIDGARTVTVQPGRVTSPGPTGLSRFRHPARIAVEDLLYLALAISDNTAGDALFGLVPPAEVQRTLRDAGLAGITVRHLLHELSDTPAERFAPDEARLAQSLAIDRGTPGRGHAIPQLDVGRANTGTARAFVDLLEALWVPGRIHAEVARPVRSLMAANVIRHRLAPDFGADSAVWSSKTGTLLNLRHEVGVVEHGDGTAVAVAALTESSVPAAVQPAAEAAMARVARALHDHVRADGRTAPW
ncbi:serine hydrolase [Streptomyces sp. 8L]|uniref:serine hydrolase n=1 Tax=Streptomyces sp. 8L TaxID=2877242 RepID=UPI001CD802F4|nr:serine hydrolase [Streptomyces sp. 8L]MCA1218426.1 class A beta-lactamase-related serine hydrolase [Streptomyces sp. 8L]